ncbi:M14 family metallopeptidase [Rariglobus hedericola]|uniref:M14 family metallocarboxypeptidase n=1 Tax=Rariglobus hedericola TaxID=2597822 RepID=A0A556QMV8_9BACT|nr:M14 family metallocarboxypeptidase [Rariglobus hedericola]TSJ77978.1 M14 family metallocarboxypeptidase [Rariglobus hedericola]
MNAVKACPLDPLSFVKRFEAAALAHGFRQEPLATIAGVPLSAYTKQTAGNGTRIYLSSGIHGDEPAAPEALLQMLESGLFDERATWFLCPLLNPTGYIRGTRENEASIDLNRDYRDTLSIEISAHIGWLQKQPRFDVTFCLHEDWETTGFYLYELNPDSRHTLADAMIEAARHQGPIESAPLIDGRESIAPGIIRPDTDPLLRDKWPEAIYLFEHHSRLGYTLETPSVTPMAQRIATHHAAVTAALAAFFVTRTE